MKLLLGRKAAAQFLDLKPPQKILDVATGTGIQACELARLGYSVTGIDIDTEVIKEAQKNYSDTSNLSFNQADSTHLPFNDNEFDACSISFALHDMSQDDQIKTLNEMKRVTKENGRILIVEYLELKRSIVTKLLYPLLKATESKNWNLFVKHGLKNVLKQVNLNIDRSKVISGLLQIAIIKNSN